jgi:hypothetical protein
MPRPLLGQRVDSVEWLQLRRSAPLDLKFPLVQCRPLSDEAHRPSGEIAREYGPCVDGDARLELRVFGVKMRRRMVAEVHLDHDAVEPAELRHPPRWTQMRETRPRPSCR